MFVFRHYGALLYDERNKNVSIQTQDYSPASPKIIKAVPLWFLLKIWIGCYGDTTWEVPLGMLPPVLYGNGFNPTTLPHCLARNKRMVLMKLMQNCEVKIITKQTTDPNTENKFRTLRRYWFHTEIF